MYIARSAAGLRHALKRPRPLASCSVRSSVRYHCDGGAVAGAKTVHVTFVNKAGTQTPASGRVGENLLHVAKEAGVDLEGACECSLACSTCHVILAPGTYAALGPVGEEEDDLLDLAFGLTPTSRLGCQVKLEERMEGARVTLPAATRNLYVDKKAVK